MAGTIVADTIQDGAGNSTAMDNAIYGSAKAWVNFNGVTTVTINAQYNVSSITRNGTGDYTVNFTNALTDANYAVVFGNVGVTSGSNTAMNTVIAGSYTGGATTKTTTQLRINCGATSSANLYDLSNINVVVLR
jgi:hypothetical protein